MKRFLFSNIVGFFIKDMEDLAVEKRFKNQLLVLFMVFMTVVSFVAAVFRQLGFYEDEVILPAFILCVLCLVLIKIWGEVERTIWIIVCIGTLLTTYNISISGGIYSYNHKWFLLFLIFVYFIFPKWLLSYTVLLVIIQACFYSLTNDNSIIQQELGAKEDALIDSIGYFVVMYLFLMAVQKYHNLLNNRIEQQTETLLIQKQELEENNQLLKDKTQQLLLSNQELERFAYIASHDLKTPLNNIISFSLLLERELQGVDNPKAHQYFGFIKDGSSKMNQLIKDVLEYSKLSATEEKEEPIDLNELVNEIETSISEYLHERNAMIKVNSELPIIKANRAKMYLLFKNLIENGIKYNESQMPMVEIKVKRESTFYEFFVVDNGIGISKEYHAAIFNLFSRLHNGSKYEGTGLGLSLSKKIVEGLGGSIRVESGAVGGSIFIVRFDIGLFVEAINNNPLFPAKTPLL